MTFTRKKIIALAACVVAVGAVLIGAISSGSGDAETPEEVIDERILVEASKPVMGDMAVEGEFIGTIDPNRQVTVIPKAAGEVLEVHYDVGDYVEAGAVLAIIDSKALELTIAQTKAAVSSAQAKANYALAMAKNDLETHDFNLEGGYNDGINQVEAGIERAENAVEQAKAGVKSAELARNAAKSRRETARRNLQDFRDDDFDYDYDLMLGPTFNEDVLRDELRQADIALDSATVALENAEIALEAAEDALINAKQSANTAHILTEEQRNKVNDSVKMAEISTDFTDQYLNIERMQNDLENYTVKAAIAGVIETRNVDPYDMASPQSPTPMFTISNKDVMVVEFKVSEASLESMRLGDSVKIDKNGTEFFGTITEIASAVDAASGLFKVKASVNNPPSSLYSGSTVKVFAETQKVQRSMMLPIDAVYYESGRPYVFVAEGETVKKVFIETGISNDDNIHVIGGLSADDLVITTWNSKIKDGASIKLSD